MARLSIPTKARLPSTLRVASSNPAVSKSFGRLSREHLIDLALQWLDEASVSLALPYIKQRTVRDSDDDKDDDDDSDDLFPPRRSVEELRLLYADLQRQKGSKREIVGRILEGDWRHGLTLYQLATADFRHLDEHPASQKWTAYRILPLKQSSGDVEEEQALKVDEESLAVPRFHPSTFLQNLQHQVLPDVKTYYQFYRPATLPLLLLRIFVVDSPYNTSLALSSSDPDSKGTSRTIFLAFPDAAPFLYVSRPSPIGATSIGDSKSLHRLILTGVPKALSRPRERWTLKATGISTNNLNALTVHRGSGRTNAAAGGWSIYASERKKESPLEAALPSSPLSSGSKTQASNRKRPTTFGLQDSRIKRAKLVAKARFGDSGSLDDGKGLEKFEVVVQVPHPQSLNTLNGGGHIERLQDDTTRPLDRRRSTIATFLQKAKVGDTIEDVADPEEDEREGWTPAVKLTFKGSHVFAGIRSLVESGIIDGERMPGWMTGEEVVTTGVVKHGRIRGQGC